VSLGFLLNVLHLRCPHLADSGYLPTSVYKPLTYYFFALIAVIMPCNIAVDVGGQPVTTTSTGMT
jgi:hypothetical protein